MGFTEHVDERENGVNERENNEENDLEKGEKNHLPRGFQTSKMQRLSATNPLRLVVEGGTTRVSGNHRAPPPPASHLHTSPAPPPPQPLATPTTQVLKKTPFSVFSVSVLVY